MKSPEYNSNLKTLIHENPQLFNDIHAFNMYPATYIHQSWLRDEISLEFFQKLIKSRRGIKRLSQMILKENHLDNDFCYDKIHFENRFTLLHPAVLMNMIILCGIAINYRTLQTIIDNQTLSKIKKSIGDDGYFFGMKRAPLIAGRIKTLSDPWDNKTDFKAFVQKSGMLFFLSHMAHLPLSLLKRLMFKFPRDLVKIDEIPGSETLPDKSIYLLKRILNTEINKY